MKYRLMLPDAADTLPQAVFDSEALALEEAWKAVAEDPSRYILVQHSRPSGRPGWQTVFVCEGGAIRASTRDRGMASELLAAIDHGFKAGAQDDWDAPEFEDARMLTKYAGASWDFAGWRSILKDLLLYGKVSLGGTVFE